MCAAASGGAGAAGQQPLQIPRLMRSFRRWLRSWSSASRCRVSTAEGWPGLRFEPEAPTDPVDRAGPPEPASVPGFGTGGVRAAGLLLDEVDPDGEDGRGVGEAVPGEALPGVVAPVDPPETPPDEAPPEAPPDDPPPEEPPDEPWARTAAERRSAPAKVPAAVRRAMVLLP
jgi:hypothetical protein